MSVNGTWTQTWRALMCRSGMCQTHARASCSGSHVPVRSAPRTSWTAFCPNTLKRYMKRLLRGTRRPPIPSTITPRQTHDSVTRPSMAEGGRPPKRRSAEAGCRGSYDPLRSFLVVSCDHSTLQPASDAPTEPTKSAGKTPREAPGPASASVHGSDHRPRSGEMAPSDATASYPAHVTHLQRANRMHGSHAIRA